MRPVDKGAAPAHYACYQDASLDLRGRLGDYCSYCERQIETHLAVEHVQSQIQRPDLENSWDNFLLSCVNCNSNKGSTHVHLHDYFWPDRDNTLRAFEYTNGGLMQPHASLAATDRVKSRETIALVGLDKFPGNTGRKPTNFDLRWLKRQQMWQCAKEACYRLSNQEDNISMREQIVATAVSRGMFSIWWTVFASDADMRRRLREGFIGTDAGSFDVNENPVPRTGGQL